MKVALAQINPIVGDIPGNSSKIIDFIHRARHEGADLIVFPELTILGYPPKDLLLKPRFIEASVAALQRIAQNARGIDALVGLAVPNPGQRGRPLFNAATLLIDGHVAATYAKSLLPTYDVFDESRYFEPSRAAGVAASRHVKLGISICEDLWNDQALQPRPRYHSDPIAELAAAGAELLVNASASPFEIDKHELREQLFADQVARHKIPLLFCNQIGGNDELIFDGASCVFDAAGRVIARAKAFQEDLLVVDLQSPRASRIEPYPDRTSRLFEALTLGTRDFVRKCRFDQVVVGLSGGIDSSLTAALAVDALGSNRVHGVAMPSRYTSPASTDDARQVAANLGISFRVIEIEAIHTAFEHQLAPQFTGFAPDVTEENVQARIRGVLLMALANKFGWLVLATGNKSELSTGYCTLYGDMVGGLAVIGDVPKTMVYELAHYVNRRAARDIIPASTLARPPTAELRPDQTDQDTLPPYDALDRILHAYVEQERSLDQIVADGFKPQLVSRVIRMVDRAEYKRKQAAPVLKVTSRAFGSGRRLPIAARSEPAPPD